jgi:uncharacterized membrane protein
MTMLIVACAVFILMHLLISGTRVRGALSGAIGEGAYMGLFSLASAVVLVWMIVAFGQARSSPANVGYWGISHATRDPAVLLVLLGFLLAVPGLLTNSPTRVRGGDQVDKPDVATGMMRISRNPFLWGVAVWAVGHLLANGRLADFILFGSLLVLAIFGAYSIDAKRTRTLGERYEAFKGKTSNIPFLAIIQGRQSFKLGEIWWRLLVGLAVWAAVLWLHPYFTGGVHPLG